VAVAAAGDQTGSDREVVAAGRAVTANYFTASKSLVAV
jgi:hypothetical protein